MRTWMAMLAAIVLAVAACGGDDDTSTESANGSVVDGGAEASAAVDAGGNNFEFASAATCVPDPNAAGGLQIRFDDGADFVSLNQVGDTVLVRARLDGLEYVDDGNPDAPVVSGTDVTWSGEMSADGEQQMVQMSFSC